MPWWPAKPPATAAIPGPGLIEIIRTFERRYPECRIKVTDVGLGRDYFEYLREGTQDMIVVRLPASEPDVVIGPVLAKEPRIVAVSADHPLADRDSVSVEDLAGYTTTTVAAAPPEVIDAFSPPVTPSGRVIRRAPLASIAQAAVRVAAGELIHPTVPAFFEHFRQPRVVGVPIADLPPSCIALAWLRAADTRPAIRAFVSTTEQVLGASRAS